MDKIIYYYHQQKKIKYKKEIEDILLENIKKTENIQKLSEYTKLTIDEVYEYIEKYALSTNPYNEKSTISETLYSISFFSKKDSKPIKKSISQSFIPLINLSAILFLILTL